MGKLLHEISDVLRFFPRAVTSRLKVVKWGERGRERPFQTSSEFKAHVEHWSLSSSLFQKRIYQLWRFGSRCWKKGAAAPSETFMVWKGIISYDMVWYGMISYDIVWYGMILYDIVWYGTNRMSFFPIQNVWLLKVRICTHALRSLLGKYLATFFDSAEKCSWQKGD